MEVREKERVCVFINYSTCSILLRHAVLGETDRNGNQDKVTLFISFCRAGALV